MAVSNCCSVAAAPNLLGGLRTLPLRRNGGAAGGDSGRCDVDVEGGDGCGCEVDGCGDWSDVLGCAGLGDGAGGGDGDVVVVSRTSADEDDKSGLALITESLSLSSIV